jgi:hypothetical protein
MSNGKISEYFRFQPGDMGFEMLASIFAKKGRSHLAAGGIASAKEKHVLHR